MVPELGTIKCGIRFSQIIKITKITFKQGRLLQKCLVFTA
jgi:hypothetical protein